MKVIPTDVYGKDGEMLRIEYHDFAGNFIVQVVWDDEDEQNSENREFLRKWGKKMVAQLGYEVVG